MTWTLRHGACCLYCCCAVLVWMLMFTGCVATGAAPDALPGLRSGASVAGLAIQTNIGFYIPRACGGTVRRPGGLPWLRASAPVAGLQWQVAAVIWDFVSEGFDSDGFVFSCRASRVCVLRRAARRAARPSLSRVALQVSLVLCRAARRAARPGSCQAPGAFIAPRSRPSVRALVFGETRRFCRACARALTVL